MNCEHIVLKQCSKKAQGDIQYLKQGFLVHKPDGTTWVFRPSKRGLFFSDVMNDIAHVFINTVDNNKSKYTVKEYYDAVHAHSLQNIIG